MKNIAVFVSGFGSNLQAILDYKKKQAVNGNVSLVFSNNRNAYALKRAKNHGIKTECFSPAEFSCRDDYDDEILKLLEPEKIDLLVLAGYMLMLGKKIIVKYPYKIINIHPALLPSFKGTDGISDAYEYGVKITGVTVHFVDEGLDSGPIILQEPARIEKGDTIKSLEEKIHNIEHKLYPLAIKLFCDDKIKVDGRKVIIFD